MHIAERFALAISRDDYAGAGALLAPGCRDEVIRSFREGRKKFPQGFTTEHTLTGRGGRVEVAFDHRWKDGSVRWIYLLSIQGDRIESVDEPDEWEDEGEEPWDDGGAHQERDNV